MASSKSMWVGTWVALSVALVSCGSPTAGIRAGTASRGELIERGKKSKGDATKILYAMVNVDDNFTRDSPPSGSQCDDLVISQLLVSGADPNWLPDDYKPSSALDLAIHYCPLEVARVLLDGGAAPARYEMDTYYGGERPMETLQRRMRCDSKVRICPSPGDVLLLANRILAAGYGKIYNGFLASFIVAMTKRFDKGYESLAIEAFHIFWAAGAPEDWTKLLNLAFRKKLPLLAMDLLRSGAADAAEARAYWGENGLDQAREAVRYATTDEQRARWSDVVAFIEDHGGRGSTEAERVQYRAEEDARIEEMIRRERERDAALREQWAEEDRVRQEDLAAEQALERAREQSGSYYDSSSNPGSGDTTTTSGTTTDDISEDPCMRRKCCNGQPVSDDATACSI